MPYSLDGLNVVYAHEPDTDSNDLLSGAPSTDLSLWDRLPFNLEDGQDQGFSEEKSELKKANEEKEEAQTGEPDQAFGHMWGQQAHPSFAPALPSNVDALQLLLSSLLQQQQQQSQPAAQLSISQLMAQQQSLGLPPSFLAANPAPLPTPSLRRSAPEDATAAPPAKRVRSRKSSISVSSPDVPVDSPASADDGSPLSAAEDKRRRNTAASARFRQKKKEREAALEARAKELQDQVTGLEKECETLRRENNWLKGLVVGVTNAGASQSQSQNAQAAK